MRSLLVVLFVVFWAALFASSAYGATCTASCQGTCDLTCGISCAHPCYSQDGVCGGPVAVCCCLDGGSVHSCNIGWCGFAKTSFLGEIDLFRGDNTCFYQGDHEEWLLVEVTLDEQYNVAEIKSEGQYTDDFEAKVTECLPDHMDRIPGYGSKVSLMYASFPRERRDGRLKVKANLNRDSFDPVTGHFVVRVELDSAGEIIASELLNAGTKKLPKHFASALKDSILIEYPPEVDPYPVVALINVRLVEGAFVSVGIHQYAPVETPVPASARAL